MRLSIIIPCYKIERYLDQCVESVCHNKTDDIEVILVDDGSPDATPQICDKWAAKDSRIRVIHQQNGGLSIARNKGMELASGEYLWFIDSDDWIRKDAVEYVLSLINQHPEIDVFVTPLTWTYTDSRKNWQDITIDEDKIVSGIGYIHKFHKTTGATPRNIIKRQIIDNANIRFLPNIVHEDGLFGHLLYNQSKKVMVLKDSLYFYRQREGSIMHTVSMHSAYSIITIHKELMKYMKQYIALQNQQTFQKRYLYLFHLAISLTWKLRRTPEFKKFLNDSKEYRISECKKCAESEKIQTRFNLYLLAYHPVLYVYKKDWKKILLRNTKASIKKVLLKLCVINKKSDIKNRYGNND